MRFEIGDVIISQQKEIASVIWTAEYGVGLYWPKEFRVDLGLYSNSTIENLNQILSALKWKHATMEDLNAIS